MFLLCLMETASESQRTVQRLLLPHEGKLRKVALTPTASHVAFAGGPPNPTSSSSSDPSTSTHTASVAVYERCDSGALRFVSQYSGHDAPGKAGKALDVDISHDGRLGASCDAKGCLDVWRVGADALTRAFQKHDGAVWGCAVSKTAKRLVSAGSDCCVRVFDIESGDELSVLDGHRRAALSVSFVGGGNDERVLSTGLDGVVRIWDTRDAAGAAVALDGHKSCVYDATMAPLTWKAASVSSDAAVLLWDVRNPQKPLASADNLGGCIMGCAMTDNGSSFVFCGASGQTSLMDSRSRMLWSLQGHESTVEGCAIAADGRVTVSVGSGGLFWFDTDWLGNDTGSKALSSSRQQPSVTAAEPLSSTEKEAVLISARGDGLIAEIADIISCDLDVRIPGLSHPTASSATVLAPSLLQHSSPEIPSVAPVDYVQGNVAAGSPRKLSSSALGTDLSQLKRHAVDLYRLECTALKLDERKGLLHTQACDALCEDIGSAIIERIDEDVVADAVFEADSSSNHRILLPDFVVAATQIAKYVEKNKLKMRAFAFVARAGSEAEQITAPQARDVIFTEAKTSGIVLDAGAVKAWLAQASNNGLISYAVFSSALKHFL